MLTHKTALSTDTNSQTPNRIAALNRSGRSFTWVIALLVSGGLFIALYTLVARANFTLFTRPVGWQTTIGTIGKQLMTEYVLAFEIVGILLLAALVGATYLASPLGKRIK